MLTPQDLKNINKALAPRFDAIDKKFEAQSKDLKAYSDRGLKDLQEYIEVRLTTQTKELKAHAEAQTEELARMIETGFAHMEDLLQVKE